MMTTSASPTCTTNKQAHEAYIGTLSPWSQVLLKEQCKIKGPVVVVIEKKRVPVPSPQQQREERIKF